MTADAGGFPAELAGVNPDAHYGCERPTAAPAATRGAMPPREQGVLVGAPHVARGLGPAELPRALEAALRAARAQSRVADESVQCRRKAFGIIGIDQQSRIADDFRQRAAVRRDDWHARRHRLERRQSEAFFERRQHEHLRALEQRFASLGWNVAAVFDMAGERRLRDRLEPLSRSRACTDPAMTRRGRVGAPRQQAARMRREVRRCSCALRACQRTACSRAASRARGPASTRVRRSDRPRCVLAGTVEQTLHFACHKLRRRR